MRDDVYLDRVFPISELNYILKLESLKWREASSRSRGSVDSDW